MITDMPGFKTSYAELAAYVTKDGSTVRELMHPALHDCVRQSLAEAVVAPCAITLAHRHHASEEIYHFLSGQGRMRLDDQDIAVTAGDTVCIAPGRLHSLENPGPDELRLLCICCPPYDHNDTNLED